VFTPQLYRDKHIVWEGHTSSHWIATLVDSSLGRSFLSHIRNIRNSWNDSHIVHQFYQHKNWDLIKRERDQVEITTKMQSIVNNFILYTVYTWPQKNHINLKRISKILKKPHQSHKSHKSQRKSHKSLNPINFRKIFQSGTQYFGVIYPSAGVLLHFGKITDFSRKRSIIITNALDSFSLESH